MKMSQTGEIRFVFEIIDWIVRKKEVGLWEEKRNMTHHTQETRIR